MRLQFIALFFLLIISFIGYVLLSTISKPSLSQNINNSSTNNLNLGGPFTLVDSNNQLFDSKQLIGRPSIIYFGFTYCPDVCVVSLQKINKLLEALDKYRIAINPVFITIDPQRDTTETLKSYFMHYDKKFIALTGNEQQIKTVAEQFKVYYSLRGDHTTNDYMLDHSTFIYLLDKNQKYLTHFTMASTIEEMVEYIRVYAK